MTNDLDERQLLAQPITRPLVGLEVERAREDERVIETVELLRSPLDRLSKAVLYSTHSDALGEARQEGIGAIAVRNGDLLQGTLDLLVLKVLGAGSNHGYGIATRLRQLSDEALRVEEGSLYPALYRLEEQGLIEAEWRPTENNRTAKFYTLTRKGRRTAQAELDSWLRLSGAITRVLRAIEQEA